MKEGNLLLLVWGGGGDVTEAGVRYNCDYIKSATMRVFVKPFLLQMKPLGVVLEKLDILF